MRSLCVSRKQAHRLPPPPLGEFVQFDVESARSPRPRGKGPVRPRRAAPEEVPEMLTVSTEGTSSRPTSRGDRPVPGGRPVPRIRWRGRWVRAAFPWSTGRATEIGQFRCISAGRAVSGQLCNAASTGEGVGVAFQAAIAAGGDGGACAPARRPRVCHNHTIRERHRIPAPMAAHCHSSARLASIAVRASPMAANGARSQTDRSDPFGAQHRPRQAVGLHEGR